MVFIHSMKVTLINLTRSQRFSLCISLLFYLLGLNTIPLGCRKTKRNFKKEQLSPDIIELSIKTFLNRLYVPKQVYLTAPKKELLKILPFLGTMSSNLKRKLLKKT